MKNGNFSEWSSMSAAYTESAYETPKTEQPEANWSSLRWAGVLACFVLAIVSGWLGFTDFMRILLLCGGFCLVA